MPSPAVEPLSSMIHTFTQRRAGVGVVIRDAPIPRSVIDMVRSGVTELGLLSAVRPPTAPEVDLHPVEEQRLVLVAPPGTFAPGRPVPRERLAGRRLIAGERGTAIRGLVEEIREAGVDLTIAVETEHREAILPLVLKGVGIGVLAEAWRPLAERAGAVVLDLDPPASLQLFLVSRKGWLSPSAARFLAIALDR